MKDLMTLPTSLVEQLKAEDLILINGGLSIEKVLQTANNSSGRCESGPNNADGLCSGGTNNANGRCN